MKKKPLYIGIIILLAGCRGIPKEAHIVWTPPPAERKISMYRITEHKAQTQGGDIPTWLLRYDAGKNAAQIEYLPGYQDKYLFIAENSGTSLIALEQWHSGFSLSLDFPGLLAPRILDRFTKEARTFPEQEFGAFFEAVIKTAYDTVYTGVVEEDDFWIKKQYVSDDGVTLDREVYEFFVLVSIPKTALQPQIQTILDTAPPQRALTKAQQTATAKIKETFFQNF